MRDDRWSGASLAIEGIFQNVYFIGPSHNSQLSAGSDKLIGSPYEATKSSSDGEAAGSQESHDRNQPPN